MNGPPRKTELPCAKLLLVTAALLGVLFATVQPDDNSRTALSQFIQWQCQTLGPMLLLLLARTAVGRLAPSIEPGGMVHLTLAGAGALLAFTPLALLLDVTLANEAAPASWTLALADEFGGLGPPAMAVWLAIHLPFRFGWSLSKPVPTKQHNAQRMQPASGLQALLPANQRGVPKRMKAELQYISVVADRGESLVLYSLGKAVAETDPAAGIQTHRSHWVRFDQITRLKRRGRLGTLELVDGTEIPVSRARLAQVATCVDAVLSASGTQQSSAN